MSLLRATPRADAPIYKSIPHRASLNLVRAIIGIPFLAIWLPYVILSYLLRPKPFPSYSFTRHVIVKAFPVLAMIEDWSPPETPEVAWGIRKLPFCDVVMERVEPIPDALRKGIAICPHVESVSRAGYWLLPKGMSAEVRRGEKVILHLHGGGYRVGHPIGLGDRIMPSVEYGVQNGLRVFAINYRKCLNPDTAFPAPLIDSLAAYLHLTEIKGVPSEDILIAGESAGGALVVILSQYLLLLGMRQPSRLMLMSPMLDSSFDLGPLDHHLWHENNQWDMLNIASVRPARNSAFRWYTDETIAGPWFSPCTAPASVWTYLENVEVYVIYGTREVMAPQIRMWIGALREAGVSVRVELMIDGCHPEVLINEQARRHWEATQREWLTPWIAGL